MTTDKKICFFLLLFLFYSFIKPGHAIETVKVCYADWLPYTFRDDSGKPQGISIDIIQKAADNMGIHIEFHHRPWKRCLQEVRENKFAGVIDAGIRDDFYQGPTSLSFYSNTIWVHAEDPLIALPSLETLNGKKAGYIDGYLFANIFFQIPDVKIDFSANEIIALKKLATRRVDFIIADLINTTFLQQDLKLPIRALKPTPTVDPLYLSFNQDNGKVHALFEAEFKRMLKEGQVNEIYFKYVGITFVEALASVEQTLPDYLKP